MDPLLQPLLRLSTTSSPEPVSIKAAKEQIDAFMTNYKHRCGAENTANADTNSISNSGGVLMSQLIHLRSGLVSD